MTNATSHNIESIEAFPLNVPLLAPFTIATARLDHVNNVAVRDLDAAQQSGIQLSQVTDGRGAVVPTKHTYRRS